LKPVTAPGCKEIIVEVHSRDTTLLQNRT
jgi:hypothetical protein